MTGYSNQLFAWEERLQKPLPGGADKTASERGKTDFRRAFWHGPDSISWLCSPKICGWDEHCTISGEQWPYLLRYLEDGRFGAKHQPGRALVSSFCNRRKNFSFFANTPRCAPRPSAMIYSLIRPPRENWLILPISARVLSSHRKAVF